MEVIYEYTVVIQGNDFIPDYGWADEHYHLDDALFDTLEEAREFVRSITPEQALEWERMTDCNGLDVVIFADPVLPDGTYELGFEIVGECEWIGDKLNLLDL